MAEPLTPMMTFVMRGAGLLVCSCLVMPVAIAEKMVDPTRPPTAPDYAQDAGAVASPVLQSVLISSGRSEAIISGRLVHVGEQLGDARVVKISESEVVLRNGNDLQTLKLFPSIEKRLTTLGYTATKPGNRGQEK
jgi:MSHA biogenesis protein MshK